MSSHHPHSTQECEFESPDSHESRTVPGPRCSRVTGAAVPYGDPRPRHRGRAWRPGPRRPATGSLGGPPQLYRHSD
eukprot:764388-Hanusia_phi.AAC.1